MSDARGGSGARSGAIPKRLLLVLVEAVERARLWLLGQRWFASVLLPALPRSVRWGMRRAYLAPVDFADRVLRRRSEGVPPKAGTFTGAVHDFAATGDAFLAALCDTAGMTASSRLLDIGCGVGRLALPVARFVDADGGYEGLDIVPDGIEWCQRNISGPHGNVHFTLADIYNKEYHPRGRTPASSYTFPYGDASFDVVALNSVFTHMLTAEVDRYLGEIARVLRPGGRCFASFFLMSAESTRLMESGGPMRFKRLDGPVWTISSRVPELGVAYDQDFVLGLYEKHGFESPPSIYLGAWCGRAGHWPSESGLGSQDAIVARRR